MGEALTLNRDYTAEDVARVVAILLRYGQFGESTEESRRQAVVCAHEVLAALSPP